MIRINALGDFEVLVDRSPVTLTSDRQRSLLAVLAVHRGRSLHPDELLEMVWGDTKPASGANALHYQISRLREKLEPHRKPGERTNIIRTTPVGYMLDESCSLDTADFETAFSTAGNQVAERPEAVSSELRSALSLWRGEEAYHDFAYEEFVRDERGRLAELRLQALELLFEAEIALGKGTDVVPSLEALTDSHPYRERFVALYLQALYAAGRQVEALRFYEQTRRRFVEELGIDVSPELRETELRILEQDPGLVRHIVERESGNVLEPLTPLIGRSELLQRVLQNLAESRMVTLVGLGGVGKTRLATQVGVKLGDRFVGGCWLADLSAARDRDRVESTVQLAVRRSERAADQPAEPLVERFRSTSALLILDNCEQVREPVAELCAELLTKCPSLRILATSRTPVGIPGELVRRVKPLGLASGSSDSPEQRRSPALELLASLMERQDMPIVGEAAMEEAEELCRALDGLPLALQLGARYLRASSVGDLLDRIEDGIDLEDAGISPERHRSLQMALRWSFELLSPEAARLFAALSVFRGTFDLDSVAAVCGEIGQIGIDEILPLVDASLVDVERGHGPATYRMLETVREFAAEMLEDDFRDHLRDRHALYFTEIAKAAGEAWSTANQQHHMVIVRRHTPNLQAAADHLIGLEAIESAAALIDGIYQFWFYSGLHRDATRTMERIASLAGGDSLEPVRRVIVGLVPLLAWGGRIDDAKQLLLKHEEMAQQIATPLPGAPQHALVGTIAWCEGDLAALRSALETRVEALHEARSIMTPTLSASLAFCLTWMGRIDEAREARDRLELRIADYNPADAHALLADVDAWIAFQAGQLDTARARWEIALDGYRQLEQTLNVAEIDQLLGWVDLLEMKLESADGRLRNAQSVISSLAMRPMEIRGLAILSMVAIARGDIDRARALLRGGATLATSSTNRLGALLLAVAGAQISHFAGAVDRALRFLELSQRLEARCSAALPAALAATALDIGQHKSPHTSVAQRPDLEDDGLIESLSWLAEN